MRGMALVTMVLLACGGTDAWEPGRSTVPVGPRQASGGHACASDLVCPLGFVCAKRAGAFTGDCARAVDEHFAPIEAPDESASYGPGPRQCFATEDCPAGFACDDGRCIR